MNSFNYYNNFQIKKIKILRGNVLKCENNVMAVSDI